MFQGLFNKQAGNRPLNSDLFFRKASNRFNPRNVPGLKLWLNAERDVYTDGGAFFNGTAYLTDGSSLLYNNTGDMTWVGWFKTPAASATYTLFGLWDSNNKKSWLLQSDFGSFKVSLSTDGTNNAVNSIISSFPTDTWAMVTFIQTRPVSGNPIVDVFLNTGGADFSLASGLFNGSAQFKVGAFDVLGDPLVGYADSIGRWNRGLSFDEIAWLYNNGQGRIFSDLDNSIKSSIIDWWDLDEIAGDRQGNVGHITLNSTNVVGGNGVAAGAATHGDPIFKWIDQASSTYNLLQTGYSLKPTFRTGVAGLKPGVRFDGISSLLATTSGFNTIGGHTSGFSMVVVEKLISPSTSGYSIIYNEPNTSGFGIHQSGVSGAISFRKSGEVISSNVAFSGSGIAIRTVIFDDINNKQSMYINNYLVSTGQASTSYANTGLLALGARIDASLPANTDIAEIIIYSGVLSNSNRISLHQYLGQQYGLGVSSI